MNLPTLKYVGEGLNFGDCSAFIQNATDSDRGEWQCHMGIKDGPEKSTNVKVRISSEYGYCIPFTLTMVKKQKIETDVTF